MRMARCLAVALGILLTCSTLLLSQTTTITEAARADAVRFIGAPAVCAMRVQILTSEGEVMLDSAWRDGNLLDWPVTLADGSYRSIVTMKNLDAVITAKEIEFTVHDGRFVPMEDRGDTRVTLVAHDGENGAIITSRGDLSFRFGDFIAGKDSERMRLTADGTIRPARGIEFPDGTILTSAAGLPGSENRGHLDRTQPATPTVILRDGARPPQSTPAAARPLKPVANAVPDYQFKVDATGVHVGTTNTFGLDVAGNLTLSSDLVLPTTSSSAAGVIKFGSFPVIHNFGGENIFAGLNAGNFSMLGNNNVGIGTHALIANTNGAGNAAVGDSALAYNTTGGDNTAAGASALLYNVDGTSNTAVGSASLMNNTAGIRNTATGAIALRTNSAGSYNTATGYSAAFNATGASNTALGYAALYAATSGSFNIAVGENAGANVTTGSYNIEIGNHGASGDANTIRIGDMAHATKAFIAGIRGATTGIADATAVLIDSNGQLGNVSSSRRYKFDIQDAADSTDGLMQLRPVTFRYRAYGPDGPLQYGLIAEEVAEVYPELVTRNKNGDVESVMYQFLAPMLLNEVQKQHRTIAEQQKTIEDLRALVDDVTRRLTRLESRSKP